VNDRLLYKVTEAAEIIGQGRTRVFELIRTGELESVRVGSRGRLVPRAALEEYVERLRAAARV
jgi:excisionase family DNA binding protein